MLYSRYTLFLLYTVFFRQHDKHAASSSTSSAAHTQSGLTEDCEGIIAVVLAIFVANDPPCCVGIRYIEENDYPVRGTYGFNQ